MEKGIQLVLNYFGINVEMTPTLLTLSVMALFSILYFVFTGLERNSNNNQEYLVIRGTSFLAVCATVFLHFS